MPNPDQPIINAVARAYALYGQQASTWMTDFTRQGGKVHCHAGCMNCCNFPIRVSLPEALLTAQKLSLEQQKSMDIRAKEIIQNANRATSWNQYFQQHREKIGYCPLLDQSTGACTAYEARPARCRDTFSALSNHYCKVGTLEQMNRQEQAAYRRQVKANPATDGQTHYIAALEDMGQNIWEVASRSMKSAWGLEVWGDFWVLTALSQNPDFMGAIRAGQGKKAIRAAKKIGLWNIEIVQVSQ